MARGEAVFALLAVAAGVLLVSQAGATVNTSPDYVSPDYNPPMDYPPMPTPTAASLDQKISAFLTMIRLFETGRTDDYNILYGGAHFSDYSKHPYEGKPLPAHSAAGAYQFIIATWRTLQNQLGLPDFSPASQDAAATELLRQKGVIAALDADNVDQAMRLASPVWASLPYSAAGQNPKPVSVALDTYNTFLGLA